MIPLVAGVAAAAQAFEGSVLGRLFAPMFDTVNTAGGVFGGGAGEAAWRPMLTDAIAQTVAAHGGLGLAAPVMQQLLHAQENVAR
jgi:flagellar protein FlgJ